MATINRSPEKGPNKVTLCVDAEGLPNPITVFFSDRKTIEPTPKAHKPADSYVPVGNDARCCSFHEVTLRAVKQAFVNTLISRKREVQKLFAHQNPTAR